MIQTWAFSPNSQRLAYAARRGNKQVVVVDGQDGQAYDAYGAGRLIFSPDSRRLAYAARLETDWRVIVDGVEEAKSYPAIVEHERW